MGCSAREFPQLSRCVWPVMSAENSSGVSLMRVCPRGPSRPSSASVRARCLTTLPQLTSSGQLTMPSPLSVLPKAATAKPAPMPVPNRRHPAPHLWGVLQPSLRSCHHEVITKLIALAAASPTCVSDMPGAV